MADPRIAFVTVQDPANPTAWSGTLHFMLDALRQRVGGVTTVGPVPLTTSWSTKARARIEAALGRGAFDHSHGLELAHRSSAWVTDRLGRAGCDVVLAAAAAPAIAFLEDVPPVAYSSDATFALLEGYYGSFDGLSARSRREANAVEGAAITRADALLYPSTWVAESATRDYGASPAKVAVVPFGANLDRVPSAERATARRAGGTCRLLFLGRDWVRKGGDLALGAFGALQAMGVPAELTICGCTPPPGWGGHEGVRVIPRLDQREPSQRRELEQLLEHSSFLLLPTRAECYGVVFCEAAAFGLPSITTATGGVTEIIRSGENGFALPLDAGPDAYAELVARLWLDLAAYERLVAGSRRQYEERLNWGRWADVVVERLVKLASG